VSLLLSCPCHRVGRSRHLHRGRSGRERSWDDGEMSIDDDESAIVAVSMSVQDTQALAVRITQLLLPSPPRLCRCR
jgi:hypothetical protein